MALKKISLLSYSPQLQVFTLLLTSSASSSSSSSSSFASPTPAFNPNSSSKKNLPLRGDCVAKLWLLVPPTDGVRSLDFRASAVALSISSMKQQIAFRLAKHKNAIASICCCIYRYASKIGLVNTWLLDFLVVTFCLGSNVIGTL